MCKGLPDRVLTLAEVWVRNIDEGDATNSCSGASIREGLGEAHYRPGDVIFSTQTSGILYRVQQGTGSGGLFTWLGGRFALRNRG